jgi:hypothetical protein
VAGDVTILAAGVEGVPTSYTVPPLQEILLKSVHAVIDGTGASGDFVPVLEIVSDAGIVNARCVGSTVTAGASADVSWFPHVASQAAAAGGALDPDWGSYFIASATVSAGSQSTSDWSESLGSSLLDLTTPDVPTFITQGVYAVTVWIQSSDTWTAGAIGGARLGYSSPANFAARATCVADGSGLIEQAEITYTAQATAGASLAFAFENFDSGDRAMYSNQALVQLIGTY